MLLRKLSTWLRLRAMPPIVWGDAPLALDGVAWRHARDRTAWHAADAASAARARVEAAVHALARDADVDFVCSVHRGVSSFRSGDAPDWREGLVCAVCGLNARQRFALTVLRQRAPHGEASRVYLSEQATPGYAAARRLFVDATGSEYAPDATRRAALEPVLHALTRDAGLALRHEDATRLSFATEAFDAIGCFDVLEHVPDWRAALHEFARVLRPGGVLVLSVPCIDAERTEVLAQRTADGGVEHLAPPEYHGDPAHPGGVLCWYRFGWDLLDALRVAGFGDAERVDGWSPALGWYGEQTAFVARR